MNGQWTGERVAGALMIASALGTVLAMAHHPSGAHGGSLGGVVHGAMIALLLLLSFGFVMAAISRGPSRPLIAAGLIAYAVSLFAHIAAATINGFVVPALASPDAVPVSHDIFRLTWRSNQALAQLGVYMTGAAYVLWSFDFIRDDRMAVRLTGFAGLAAGLVPAALLVSQAIRMDVAGAFLVYAIHAAWAALVGFLLLRGALQSSRNSATSS